jgi:hypothetical protein
MSVFYEQGRYACEIVQQAMTKASTGTPQFVLRFRVIEFSNGEPVPQQYERTSYRAITEKTMPYVQRDLDVLGFTGDSLRQLDPSNPNYQNFVGQTVEFNCNHEKDQNGDLRERWGVAWNAPSKEIEGDPLESSQYRQLDALFNRNRSKSTSSAQPKQQANQPAQQPVPRQSSEDLGITDEDIPF